MSAINKTAFMVMGPTASGKTSLAIRLASYLNTEIISADSRQCYKELSVGVARPSDIELQSVTHHFVASHSIQEKVDAAIYEKYAIEKASKIFEKHNQVVVCGGTGLYINAFCKGIDDIPIIEESVKVAVREKWESEGLVGLQKWIADIDPPFWAKTNEKNNHVRLMRALEVKLTTGKSLVGFQKGIGKKRGFTIKKIYIDWPRELLYERINQRVDLMMAHGLLEEVKSLVPYRSIKALQTVGYQELFGHLEGKYSLEEAVSLIKQHTRNYAKRQVTWFKKEGWDISLSGQQLESVNIPMDILKI